MKALILNGSPRTKGTVAAVLKQFEVGLKNGGCHTIEWIDVPALNMQTCNGCMRCRSIGTCALPEDDAHHIGKKIAEADTLIVGSPTHWGNMSAALKVLFDRNVPVFIKDGKGMLPVKQQKGKQAILVSACTSPSPFHLLPSQSGGTVRALKSVLKSGGYRISDVIHIPGTRKQQGPSEKSLLQAERTARQLAKI